MGNVRINIACLLLISGLVVGGQPRCVAADRSRGELILISLRSEVQTDSRVIRVVDVANVTGGDAVLRERVKQLDLEDALADGETVTILPPQVEFRLRIAGLDVDKVSIRGGASRVTSRETAPREADIVTNTGATAAVPMAKPKPRRAVDFSSISVDEGPLEREVIQAAKACLLNKLPWPAENVDIRLSQALPAEVQQAKSATGYNCSAELRSSGPAVGRVQVRVIAQASQKPSFDVTVHLEVRHFEKVALTTRTLDRGHVIAASDVYLDRQDVTELSDYCSTMNELIGTTTRRQIRSLVPLRMNDIESQNRSETSILVKRREQVKMTARLDGLSVTAMGEALQDGRMGETIRLKNIESNATVQGRVIRAGEVEISF